MGQATTESAFTATLHHPAQPGESQGWAFLLVPKAVSDRLPRRGRTSVTGSLNGHAFQATLEPDGALGHWLKIDRELQTSAGIAVGDSVAVVVTAMAKEPEPVMPADFEQALAECEAARRVWDATTTLARVDWIHWVESAKQAKTRHGRIVSACDMLASGKQRVCCFDPSGYYSKGLRAPRMAK